MKHTLSIIALALLLLFAGCDYFGVAIQPGVGPSQPSGDPEVGGGQLEPFAEEVGGGREQPENVLPAAATLPAGLPPTAAGERVALPQVSPGESVQRGAVTFTLEQVSLDRDRLVIHFTLKAQSGETLPAAGDLLIKLADGKLLAPTGGAGGGAGNTGGAPGEAHRYTFPAPPGVPVQFTLLLSNQWSGAPETWEIPVALQQLQ